MIANNLVMQVGRVQVLDAVQDVLRYILDLVYRIDFSSRRHIHIIFNWILMLEVVLEYALMSQHFDYVDLKEVHRHFN